jgi:hypothetical protein
MTYVSNELDGVLRLGVIQVRKSSLTGRAFSQRLRIEEERAYHF